MHAAGSIPSRNPLGLYRVTRDGSGGLDEEPAPRGGDNGHGAGPTSVSLYANAAQETRAVEGGLALLPESVIPSTILAYAVRPRRNGSALPQPIDFRFGAVDASCGRSALRVAAPPGVPTFVTYLVPALRWAPSYVAVVRDAPSEEREGAEFAESGIASLALQATVINETESDLVDADVTLVLGEARLPGPTSRGPSVHHHAVALRAIPAAAEPSESVEYGDDEGGGIASAGGSTDADLERIPIGRESLRRGRTMFTAVRFDRFDGGSKIYVCDIGRGRGAGSGGEGEGDARVAFRFRAPVFLPAGQVAVYDRAASLLGSARIRASRSGEPVDILLGRPTRVSCATEVTVVERVVQPGERGRPEESERIRETGSESESEREREEQEEARARRPPETRGPPARVTVVRRFEAATEVRNGTGREIALVLVFEVGDAPFEARPRPTRRERGRLEWMHRVPPRPPDAPPQRIVTLVRTFRSEPVFHASRS